MIPHSRLPFRRGPSRFAQAADGTMPLMEHLRELRGRLFKATLAVAAGMIVGYVIGQPVFEFLARPYCNLVDTEGGCTWNWLAPTDAFTLRLKLALWVGLIISAPLWMYQLWAFVAPGLHGRERRWAYVFGGLAVPLFAAGAGLAYFVLNRGLQFLFTAGVVSEPQTLEPTRYISFVSILIFAFGVSFQFPVLVLLLNFSGLVSARKLLRAWRVAVFACVVFAALVTPDPGPFGMMLLAACLSAMYFAAVGVAFLNDRRRAKHRQPWEDLPDDETSPLDEELEPVTAGEGIEAAMTAERDPLGGHGGSVAVDGDHGGPSDAEDDAHGRRRYDDLI